MASGRIEKIILFFLVIVSLYFSFLILIKTSFIESTHYLELAKSFLHGRLDLTPPLKDSAYYDIAYFEGKYYIYFGIVPAILFVPIVALFGDMISQQILPLTFLIVDFYFLYKIIQKYTQVAVNTLWLSIYFIFGTSLIHMALVNITSYLVQIIATSFLIAALYEFHYKRRWLLIGLLVALAGATRYTFYLTSIYFILHILFVGSTRIKILSIFLIPIIASLFINGFYNLVRFKNPLETGYNYPFIESQNMFQARSIGTFSIKHVPGNLYSLFYRGFEEIKSEDNPDNILLKYPFLKANPLGLSILITSPLFIFTFLAQINRNILFCWINILILLALILTFYSLGFMQYGFRYALDLYPFLFLILASVFKTALPPMIKGLIVYSILFNFIFAQSIWGVYFS